MKHTPGPWFVNEDRQNCMGDGIVFRNIYHKRSGLDVCLMLNNVIANNLDKPEKSEGEANARLIAAAPKLLETCKRIKEFIEDNIGWINDRASYGKDESLFVLSEEMDHLYQEVLIKVISETGDNDV